MYVNKEVTTEPAITTDHLWGSTARKRKNINRKVARRYPRLSRKMA
jgi:hypothetical protein